MKQLLKDTLRDIQEAGIQEARVVLLHNDENRILMRGTHVEEIRQESIQSMAITMWQEGREGFFYTNDLTPSTLRDLIQRAAQTTMLLQPDPNRGLPSPQRYYQGDGADLCNCDPTLATTSIDDKQQLLTLLASATPRHDSLIAAESHYTDRTHRAWYADTQGLDVQECSSRCALLQTVTIQGQGDQHPMDGWGQTRIDLASLTHPSLITDIAETAMQRTLRKTGQHPIASGTYTMVVESPVADHLLMPILSALSGQALWQGTSFLKGHLHQPITSPLLTLIDDPHIPGTMGATHFDYDGVRTQPRHVIREGILQTYFLDTLSAKRLGMEPTTQGVHHLILQPDQGTPIRDEEYILVTDFNGGNCDPTTGQFSYGVEGFLMRGDIILQPISGMNITGDMLTLWKSLVHTSHDGDPHETFIIPTLTFRNVQFGGV